MMMWLILIKLLIITEACQSLTVIQPIYDYNDNYYSYYKPKELQDNKRRAAGVTDSSIRNEARRTQPNGVSHRTAIAKSEVPQPPSDVALTNRLLSRVEPYKSGMISNILSLAQPGILAFKEQPAWSTIYPVQYQYQNPYHKALRRSKHQPVTAATLQTEVLHEPQELSEFVKQATEQPLLNYNNNVYHVNKAITNQSYTQQYPPFIRKPRNSNSNHYDDKLIEHNFTEIRAAKKDDDYGQDFNRTASSIKQPSAATASSHETRYLHDIFLNYPKYHHVNYGHIELSPHLFEKRFETLKAGNRYKGEVISLDNTGGYSQHYWNMAQGKL